ncbi:MAG: tetratricopeptide repeat protein [Burkholderiaceae bacterium]
MTVDVAEDRYSLRRLVEIIGLSRTVVMALVEAGYVTPSRGPGNQYRFGFRDLVVLRAAHHLQAAAIPPRRMLAALRRLRATLPTEAPMHGLRLKAFGDDIAVKRADDTWESPTGQLVMDFEVPPANAPVRTYPAPSDTRASPPARSAADWFLEGERLEEARDPAAEQAYRSALQASPDHVDAYLNLGVLLCESKRCEEAVDLYRTAIDLAPDEPLLHFNAAIALEDLAQDDAALASYERCLALMPTMADAHFNAARLHERRGDVQRALRHFSAYRRLHKAEQAELVAQER